MTVVALVLAGGIGSRMGRPKQFLDLLGKPVLLHTLQAFQRAPEVARIYAVGDARRIELLAEEHAIDKYVGCAAPGESRSHSTRNGLDLMRSEREGTVALIHDGCRCLVTPELIGRVAGATGDGADGVIPALPVSDTIKVASGESVEKTLDRSLLRAVQTPQAFRMGLLREIFSSSEEFLASATDDASLVEKSGGEVRIVLGERTNIKLTSPEDLVLAEAILLARNRKGHHARRAAL